MNSYKKYLKNRQKAFNLILDEPEEAFNTHTIHKLRIEIKKLNNFCHLLNYCIKDFNRKKIFKPYRRIFWQAGKLRELQIEETMLVNQFDVESIGNYMQNLAELQLKTKKDFFNTICQQRERAERGYRKIIHYTGQIDGESAKRYLESRKRRVDKLLDPNILSSDKVHELRKRIIRFNHVLKCVDPLNKNYLPFEKHGLAHILGEWHDCQKVIRRLNRARKTKVINHDEIEKLGAINEMIASESELLYLKIKKTLPQKILTANQRDQLTGQLSDNIT